MQIYNRIMTMFNQAKIRDEGWPQWASRDFRTKGDSDEVLSFWVPSLDNIELAK